jgi:hypothetical protein
MLVNITTTTPINLKPCNHTALSKAYGISNKVLHTHVKPFKNVVGKRVGHFYTLEQLLIIVEKLGISCYSIM